MGYAAQNHRDLLVMAGVLRRFAQENGDAGPHALLLQTAATLEAQAFSLSGAGPRQNLAPAIARHALVNMLV